MPQASHDVNPASKPEDSAPRRNSPAIRAESTTRADFQVQRGQCLPVLLIVVQLHGKCRPRLVTPNDILRITNKVDGSHERRMIDLHKNQKGRVRRKLILFKCRYF